MDRLRNPPTQGADKRAKRWLRLLARVRRTGSRAGRPFARRRLARRRTRRGRRTGPSLSQSAPPEGAGAGRVDPVGHPSRDEEAMIADYAEGPIPPTPSCFNCRRALADNRFDPRPPFPQAAQKLSRPSWGLRFGRYGLPQAAQMANARLPNNTLSRATPMMPISVLDISSKEGWGPSQSMRGTTSACLSQMLTALARHCRPSLTSVTSGA